MMSEPIVSVLIPCYNAERWVAETLDSVLAQTWPNLDIVVVNDGSTDGSRAVLAHYESRGVRVVDQQNRGQTAALNTALAHARGDFIQYLDADDLLSPDKIRLQMERLQVEPDAIALGEWARFQHALDEARFEPAESWQDHEPVDWLVRNWHEGGGMMYPALWLMPRALVSQIGPWDESLNLLNDTDYFTRAVLAARRVLFSAGARTYYRSGLTGSLSGLKSERGWRSQERVLTLCETYLLQRETSDRTRRVCSLLWQRFAQASYPYVPRLANNAIQRAHHLHSVRLKPDGGRVFKLLAVLIGWRFARRLQTWSGRP
ncbi:MAG: glycosyltransferase family A protein [Pseudomonadota bacterium]